MTAAVAAAVLGLVTGVWLCRATIARSYNDRGAVAYAEGRLADAEAALQRAVRLDPSNALAHHTVWESGSKRGGKPWAGAHSLSSHPMGCLFRLLNCRFRD